MRSFGIISSSIWRSRRFRQLETDTARLVYLYLHTSSHGNSAGAFVLPPEMAALDLKISGEIVREDFSRLASAGLIRYDPEEELVQIRGFFRFNAISSRKHLQGPLRIIKALPQSPVRDCAACDLVLAVFERRQEWADKARRLRQSESKADATEAQKIAEAIGGFDVSAADLVKDLHLEDAITSREIGLSADAIQALSEALMIPLSYTPIDTTETEKETEKTKTTDKTKTKITDKTTERGSGGEGQTTDELIAALNEKARGQGRR